MLRSRGDVGDSIRMEPRIGCIEGSDSVNQSRWMVSFPNSDSVSKPVLESSRIIL